MRDAVKRLRLWPSWNCCFQPLNISLPPPPPLLLLLLLLLLLFLLLDWRRRFSGFHAADDGFVQTKTRCHGPLRLLPAIHCLSISWLIATRNNGPIPSESSNWTQSHPPFCSVWNEIQLKSDFNALDWSPFSGPLKKFSFAN